MNIFQRVLAGVARRAIKLAGIHPQDPAVAAYFGIRDTSAGVWVDENTALNISAVWAGTRLLAETVGSLPLEVYRRTGPGESEKVESGDLYRLCAVEPNPEMSPMSFRSALQGQTVIRGNAYAEIERRGDGSPVNLWPLPSNCVRLERDEQANLVYVYDPINGGKPQGLRPENVLHIAGFGSDGLVGLGVVALARESLGLTAAAEKYGAAYFGNGARPDGVLTHPGKLSPPARKNIRTDWEMVHRGLDRAHRIAILDEGVTYNSIGFSPEDSQFLQTRKFQISEIARWIGVPPHMIGDLERSTNNNIEQQSLEFVCYSLCPWFVRWENEMRRKLVAPGQRDKTYLAFDANALLRGAMLTRFQAWAQAKNWGFMNADEIRSRENMNPIPGGIGKKFYVPVNMVDASLPPAVAAPGAPPNLDTKEPNSDE